MNESIIQSTKKSMADSPKKSMQKLIQQMEPEIKKALPSVITPERFTRMVLSAMSTTPKLYDCTPQSFLGAMMTAAQLGMEPNTPLGQAYLIPRNNRKKGVMECQFQLGYKGLIDLAYRSGEVNIIQAHTVHRNDEFEYELGLDPKLRHVPAVDDRGDAVAYYAMFRTKDGGCGFAVMSKAEVVAFARNYSESYNSSFSPWKTNFDEMAKKTVLKKALKYAPLKSDFARSMASDETVKSTLDEDMFTVPDETIFETEGEILEETFEEVPADA